MHSHLGVFPSTFKLVLHDIETLGGLAPTRYISTWVQLAIFLYICKEGLGVRHAGEAFQRSLDTISKWVIPSIPLLRLSSFKAVVQAFTCPTYYSNWILMPTYSIPHPTNLLQDTRFNPWFQDCMGAMDGTFIPVNIGPEHHPRYRTRKKTLIMIVLACCTFDLRFCCVLAGWEGSATDVHVYQKALSTDLKIPHGPCFLADAGYVPTAATLTSYRGVRYHLKEWGRSGQK